MEKVRTTRSKYSWDALDEEASRQGYAIRKINMNVGRGPTGKRGANIKVGGSAGLSGKVVGKREKR